MAHEKAPITLQEFGFVTHEAGPPFQPRSEDLLPAFRDLEVGQLPTQLLETDKGNQVLVCSLVGAHPKLRKIADSIEDVSSSEPQYSADLQKFFLQIVRGVADEHGRGVKTVVGSEKTVFYGGNIGVSNGRLLRVYASQIGSVEGVPVIAKIAASRTKESEKAVYRVLGIDGRITL